MKTVQDIIIQFKARLLVYIRTFSRNLDSLTIISLKTLPNKISLLHRLSWKPKFLDQDFAKYQIFLSNKTGMKSVKAILGIYNHN